MATTNGVTSDATRALIRTAAEKGRTTRAAVMDFTTSARAAIGAYDTEVNPLRLSDDRYEGVERASGLRDLLDIAADVEGMVVPLFDRAAWEGVLDRGVGIMVMS